MASEFYSPPRVAKKATDLGMKGGFSLDFSHPDQNGYIWDFDQHECRKKAMQLIREKKPYMIIGSPECTPFSQLQELNKLRPGGKEKVAAARERGIKHLEFCCKIYLEQVRGGDVVHVEGRVLAQEHHVELQLFARGACTAMV